MTKKHSATPLKLTRIERAQFVRDEIMKLSVSHGRWEFLEWGEGHTARVWRIEPNARWYAYLCSRFSRSDQTEPLVKDYDEALLLQLAPPRSDDVVLDLYVEPFSKVLSLGTTDGTDTLITMQPGPWEEMFGLASRPWAPAVARRLASRESEHRLGG